MVLTNFATGVDAANLPRSGTSNSRIQSIESPTMQFLLHVKPRVSSSEVEETALAYSPHQRALTQRLLHILPGEPCSVDAQVCRIDEALPSCLLFSFAN